MHAFLSTCIAFDDIFTRACTKINDLRPTTLDFWVYFLLFIFRLSFFSFYYIFAVLIYLLMVLLPVQKFLTRSIIETGNFYHGNFAASFSLKFFNIFLHISAFIKLITLIWVSMERSFPPADLEYR